MNGMEQRGIHNKYPEFAQDDGVTGTVGAATMTELRNETAWSEKT